MALTPMMGTHWQLIPDFSGNQWLILLVGTILYGFGGWPFIMGAQAELSQRKPAMMTLITLGITVAYGYSVWTLWAPQHIMAFWWELATLIVIMLLGHWVEMRAIRQANSALDALANLLPKMAIRTSGEHISLQDIQIGDHLQVPAHERIPADSILLSEHAQVDESLLTGEAQHVHKHKGDALIGGAINGSHTLHIQVAKTGEASYLGQVQQLVAQAQQQKSRVETRADRVAGWLFYAAVLVAVVAFGVWLLVGNMDMAVMSAVMVLIIACPHALGLAVPLVSARLSGLAAQRGLFIQNKTPLEKTEKLRAVLLDKTGTLTKGDFQLVALHNWSDLSDDALKAAVLALESGNTHPIALALQRLDVPHDHQYSHAHHVQTVAGDGVKGHIGHDEWRISQDGGAKQMTSSHTVSYIWRNDTVVGALELGDTLKSDAQAFITQLKERHLTPVLVTGDRQQVAQNVAEKLGITHVHAQVTPEQKATLVQQYQANGDVLFIGDGVNDGPALAKADLGIAIGAGTAVAIDSADIVLSQSNPSDALAILDLAPRAQRKMVENLWWGAGYNVFALPLAAGVLAPVGVTLTPLIAALLMSASTIIVAVNALRLR
jgi:Cu2+-exporting ATPase